MFQQKVREGKSTKEREKGDYKAVGIRQIRQLRFKKERRRSGGGEGAILANCVVYIIC